MSNGQEEKSQKLSGYLFIDVDSEGGATIHVESSNQTLFGPDSMEIKPDASNLFFPLPESSLGRQPIVQSFTRKGLGISSTYWSPDIVISETLTKTANDGSKVHLTFSRKGLELGNSPIDFSIEEEGKGIFDTKAGRYSKLKTTSKLISNLGNDGEKYSIVIDSQITLEFDAQRSKERTKEKALTRRSSCNSMALAEYLRENSVKSEVEDAVESLGNIRMPTSFLMFHLQANPVATWQQVMTMPVEIQAEFIYMVRFPVGIGWPVPQSVIDWIKVELVKQPVLEHAVVSWGDERLRPELVSIATLQDPEKESIANQARASMKIIDIKNEGPRVLLNVDKQDFVQLGHTFLFSVQDHREFVQVLIEILKRSQTLDSNSKRFYQAYCVQWLEGLVSRPFGQDVNAWTTFWEANKHKSRCQWLMEAADQDTPVLVYNALIKLSTCRNSHEAGEYLASRVQKDEGRIRDLAALSLADHKDMRAIPALIEMLTHESEQLRMRALIALANFGSMTLGYRPEEDDASRAAAVQRWRAWAQERESSSD